MQHKHKTSDFQSTMPTDRAPIFREANIRLNRSVEYLNNPFEKSAPCKFPKRACRKQTGMTMLIETEQQNQKPCLKVNHQSSQSSIFDNQPVFLKKKALGTFHSLSFDSRPGTVEKRSAQDIGIQKNRKRINVFKQKQNNPILIGDDNVNTRPSKKFNQQGIRTNRDKGQRIKQNMVWQKQKPRSYFDRYMAMKEIK